MVQTARVPWWRERLLFVALLLALASALVPALFPSGSPMNRLHGSAFDPTTHNVTLRVRSEHQRVIATPTDPEGKDRATQTPPALHIAVAPVPVGAVHVAPVAPAPAISAQPAKPRPAGIALPRAPPAAM